MDHWSSLLNGKIVFLTGGAGWIARHIAKKCHEHGARIVLADRQLELAESLQRDLVFDDNENDKRIFSVEIDVNDEQTIERAVQLTLMKWKTIDILVNTCVTECLDELLLFSSVFSFLSFQCSDLSSWSSRTNWC